MYRWMYLCLCLCAIGCQPAPRQEDPTPSPPEPADAIATVIVHDLEIPRVFANKLLVVTKEGSIILFTPNAEVYPTARNADALFVSLVQQLTIDNERVFHGMIYVDELSGTPFSSPGGWKIRFGEPAPGNTGVDYAVLHIEAVRAEKPKEAPEAKAPQ